MSTSYTIIDNTKLCNKIYETLIYDNVVHEYMSIVNNVLQVLKEFNIEEIPNRIHKDNLYIVSSVHDDKKRYPMYLCKYWYDFNIKTIVSEHINTELCKNNTQKCASSKIVKNTGKKVYRNTKFNKNSNIPKKGLLNSTVTELPNNNGNNGNNGNNDNNRDNGHNSIVDISDIKQCINELKAEKEKINNEKEKIIEENDNINKKKRELKKVQEKERERRRKFEVNIDIYRKVKIDLEKGILKEIPELFEKEYPVFEVMDEQGELDKPIDVVYDTFTYLYDESYPKEDTEKKEYVPHNINYVTKGNDIIKDGDISKDNKKDKKEKSNEIPPLEKVLDDISDLDISDDDTNQGSDLINLEDFDTFE